MTDYWCCLSIWHSSERQSERERWELPRRELKPISRLRSVTVVPVITGALGTVSKDIEKWLAETGVTCSLEALQTACLLGTARILRTLRHLRSWEVTWCLRKTPASHSEDVFNNNNNNINNNNNNNTVNSRLADTPL